MLFTAIVIYLAVLLLASVWISKNLVHDSSDYWVGGRKMGLLVVTGSIAATFLSGASLIGYPGMYYSNGGFAAPWHMLGTVAGWMLIVIFFIHKVRRTGFVTLPDVFGDRFGEKARFVSAGITIYVQAGYMVLQLAGIGAILSLTLGWNWATSIAIGFIVVVIYVYLGGYVAVAWSDVFQVGIMVIGVLIAAPLAVSQAGGFGAMRETLMQQVPWFFDVLGRDGYFDVQMQIRLILMFGLANLAFPAYYVRILSARNEITARNSFILGGLLVVFFWMILIVLAAAGKVLVPGIPPEAADTFMPTMINTVFPPFTAAIVLCAVLAAIMSTCDSVLHVAGTTIARDFYQRLVPGASEKKLLSVSRASILIVGAIGLIIALLQTSIIFDLLIFIWNFVANAIAVPLIASFYWKRANETGAVASMVAGMVVTVIWVLSGQPYGINEFYPGVIAAVAGLVIGSLVTPPSSKKILDKYFGPHMALRPGTSKEQG